MIQLPEKPTLSETDLPAAHKYDSFHPFIKGVFSQWHPTPFEVDGAHFVCAEQYMMVCKAVLFGDRDIAEKIMATDDPALQKRLGSQVRHFDQGRWHHWRYHIVYAANHAKFSQNSGALRRLANTAPAMLVEANPRDWNWGNGLQIDDPRNHNPSEWRGSNLLGRILTLTRDQIEPH